MCNECEGRRVQPRNRGVDVDGRTLRDYRCLDCGNRFSTVEVVTPLRLFVLDPERKRRNRAAQRKRRGYRGSYHGGGRPIKPEPRLLIRVSVA